MLSSHSMGVGPHWVTPAWPVRGRKPLYLHAQRGRRAQAKRQLIWGESLGLAVWASSLRSARCGGLPEPLEGMRGAAT